MMAFVNTKGRFDALITAEAVDAIEAEGKRLIFSVYMKDGRLCPEIIYEDFNPEADEPIKLAVLTE